MSLFHLSRIISIRQTVKYTAPAIARSKTVRMSINPSILIVSSIGSGLIVQK
jgi:hypothetical protein